MMKNISGYKTFGGELTPNAPCACGPDFTYIMTVVLNQSKLEYLQKEQIQGLLHIIFAPRNKSHLHSTFPAF